MRFATALMPSSLEKLEKRSNSCLSTGIVVDIKLGASGSRSNYMFGSFRIQIKGNKTGFEPKK
jgi:hypothetical protein